MDKNLVVKNEEVSLYNLFKQLSEAQLLLFRQESLIKAIKLNIANIYSEALKQSYSYKSEPFGVVNFDDGYYKVSFNTPKNVSWDQAGLKELYKEGAPVAVKYSLSETVFKALDDVSQAAFMPYRTTTPGAVTVTIEEIV